MIFLYITLKLLKKYFQGPIIREKLSPAKLAGSVCRQFCSTKIFPVVIEFHFHGKCGASNRGSRFDLRRFYLKKQSLSEFCFCSRKKFIQKEIGKNVADVFCNITFTNDGWRQRQLLKKVTIFLSFTSFNKQKQARQDRLEQVLFQNRCLIIVLFPYRCSS